MGDLVERESIVTLPLAIAMGHSLLTLHLAMLFMTELGVLVLCGTYSLEKFRLSHFHIRFIIIYSCGAQFRAWFREEKYIVILILELAEPCSESFVGFVGALLAAWRIGGRAWLPPRRRGAGVVQP